MRQRSHLVAAIVLVLVLGGLPPTSVAAGRPRCGSEVATIVGSPGDDRIEGTPGPDVIVGRGGDDQINGKGGRDLICGGAGDDYLSGGRHDDRLLGGAGQDTFLAGRDRGHDWFDGGTDTDLLSLRKNWVPPGRRARVDLASGDVRVPEAGRDSVVLGSIENVESTGHSDVIKGDDSDNALYAGSSGNRVRLIGRGGNDLLVGGQDPGTTFRGGPGDDVINLLDYWHVVRGGAGTDLLTFCRPHASTSVGVEVDLAAGTSRFMDPEGGAETSRVASLENVVGCAGNDSLRGDDGANRLAGGLGDDILEGRGGDDTLIGGEGEDSADGGDGTDSCLEAEATVNCE